MGLVIALDLGTSGFRAQAIDAVDKAVVSSAFTVCHPVPGSNVIDHALFAMTFGRMAAHRIVIDTVNKLIEGLMPINQVELIAVCGNPAQLSLFTGDELTDLVLSDDSLGRKGIVAPDRTAKVIDGKAIGLRASCDVFVPPAIKAEVGADAIAMILKSGMMDDSLSIAIDVGTNAEMALRAGSRLYVGSAAAGPAIEGRHIGSGMLAAPGAIADIAYAWGWRNIVLDERLEPQPGDIVALDSGRVIEKGPMRAKGITGTGVISIVAVALAAGYADPPKIKAPVHKLFLQDGIEFTEADLAEAGKAFGAIRAGQKTLAERAGVPLERIAACYAAGAAGSFMDPLKARNVGIVPAGAARVSLLGNTSLEMAGDLALGEERLGRMQNIADEAEYVDFSGSAAFERHYLRELAYWCEGARYEHESARPVMHIIKRTEKRKPGQIAFMAPDYRIPVRRGISLNVGCCPYGALTLEVGYVSVDLKKCRGASCLRCERACEGFKLAPQ